MPAIRTVLRYTPPALLHLAAIVLMLAGFCLFVAILGTGIAPHAVFASWGGNHDAIYTTASDIHLTGAFLVSVAGGFLELSSRLILVRIRVRLAPARPPAA